MQERTCSIDNCGGLAEVKGWCTKHYQRWKKHGDPLVYRPDLAAPDVRKRRESARNRWRLMINRCTKPTDPAWPNYGGRGITVCPEWLESFDAYYAHIGDPPFPGATVDREDNDGAYAPGNVRWSTRSEQATNRRRPKPKTHCVHGHEFTPENTRIRLVGPYAGGRRCIACEQETNAGRTALRRQFAERAAAS